MINSSILTYDSIWCYIQGLLYLLSPVTFTLLTRYPRLQAYCAPAGLVITVIGSLLSSFAEEVWHLIATQGVMCAIGNGLLFSPSSLYLDQWFVRRKGLALGTMWAAKSITGVALPFVAATCLVRFGSSTTLRAWTIITVWFSGFTLFLSFATITNDSTNINTSSFLPFFHCHSWNLESQSLLLLRLDVLIWDSLNSALSGCFKPATSCKALATSYQQHICHPIQQPRLDCPPQWGQC